MSDVITISREDFDRQEERLRKLAREKANIQLVLNLMASLSAAQGLEDTVKVTLETVLEHVGGTNLSIFYKIDEELFYADVLGERKRLEALEDPLVRQVFETRVFLERQHDFQDTKMTTPEFTCASTWVFPLVVGSDLVGAFKIESMHILARDLQSYLPTFFAHAALILKNEILGYTRLQKAYGQLEQEMIVRRQAEQELREAKAGLEQKVAERTVELRRANRLYDVLSRVNRATVRTVSREELLSEVCGTLVEQGQFHLAWVGIVDWDTLKVRPAAWAGPAQEYVDRLELSLEESPARWGPVRDAVHHATPSVRNNLSNDSTLAPWQDAVVKAGFHAEAAVPVQCGGRVEGAIAIYSLEEDVFHDEEVALLEEIAADVSKGLDRINAEADRKRAEELLREKTEELDRYFNNALDLLCIADRDGYFRRLNPQWELTFGYSLSELEGKRFLDLVHPDDLDATLAEITRLDRQGEVLNFINRFRCKDGSYRWIEWRSFPLEERIYAVARDITENKRAEEALRQSEERHRAILQTALDGFLMTDLQGNLLEVNHTYCKMMGYSEQELLGMNIADMKADGTRKDTVERIKNILLQGKEVFESQHRCKDGHLIDLEISAQHYTFEEGRLVAFLRDITARKQAEQEREKLQEKLSQAEKMESVGRLAGGVAHDFNNMLGVIIGYSEMALARLDAADPLHANLAEIRQAAERSADLTRQLLAFARKQTVVPKVLDLNEAVRGMFKMLQRLIGENIELVWQPGAQEGWVKMDPSQIDQILANLCVNARDAITDVGRVTIETANTTLDEDYCAERTGLVPGEYVRLSVSDNGCGMDAETLAHLFEPFFTTKGLGQGTGLGLATVYGAVTQNKGYVHATSVPGQGTTLTIYLPRHVERAEQLRATGPDEAGGHSPATVLLVEDESSMLNMCRMMLRKLGYDVLAASSPGEAIHLAETHRGDIHLLITDVIMPEMNGRDLAKKLLSIYPGIKRLFMSGYTADVIAFQGVLSEGVHFIQKPFTLDALDAKVRETLGEG